MVTDQDTQAMVRAEARFFHFLATALWRWPGFLVFLLELQWLHPHPMWGELIVFGGTLWCMAFLYNFASDAPLRERNALELSWRARIDKLLRLAATQVDLTLATWAAKLRAMDLTRGAR